MTTYEILTVAGIIIAIIVAIIIGASNYNECRAHGFSARYCITTGG